MSANTLHIMWIYWAVEPSPRCPSHSDKGVCPQMYLCTGIYRSVKFCLTSNICLTWPRNSFHLRRLILFFTLVQYKDSLHVHESARALLPPSACSKLRGSDDREHKWVIWDPINKMGGMAGKRLECITHIHNFSPQPGATFSADSIPAMCQLCVCMEEGSRCCLFLNQYSITIRKIHSLAHFPDEIMDCSNNNPSRRTLVSLTCSWAG